MRYVTSFVSSISTLVGASSRTVAAMLVAALAVIAAAAAGATALVSADAGPVAAWRASPSASVSPPGPSSLPCGGWDCALAGRFAKTAALVASRRGNLGIVVRDRTTGLTWTSGSATHPVWTASTIKLAIVADLLVRARAGEITITSNMRAGFADMLEISANRPATNLWYSHGGPAALERYRSVFGMTGVHFPTDERLWGAVKCSAEDLAALMAYVLDKMHPADRRYLVEAMRDVDKVQQWGVWAAGSKLKPGVKDGWNVELNPEGERGWVINSVGFAGPDERYVVAVMYELEPGTQVTGNTVHDGVQTVSDVVATLFGAKVPASVPSTSLLVDPPGATPGATTKPSPSVTP